LTDLINKRIERDLESRVRRSTVHDRELNDFDSLLSLSEGLLAQLQAEHPHHAERVEFLYRRIL